MRKTLVFLFIVVTTTQLSAQVFRVGTGIGFGGSKTSGGVNINLLELGIAPSPQLEFGIYGGLAANAKASVLNSDASIGFRYGTQGKYYFREEGFKPYAGLQLGLFQGATGEVNTIQTSVDAEKKVTKFNIAPMAGFRLGPLNVNLAYQSGLKLNLGLLFGFGNFRE